MQVVDEVDRLQTLKRIVHYVQLYFSRMVAREYPRSLIPKAKISVLLLVIEM